jgi:arylsulfatase A-like enzyme
VIVADDLGWNDLTFGGGGVAGGTVPTSRIDSIAAEGVDSTHGYAANGTCAPSRAALMSARYGTRFDFEFTPTPPGMIPLAALAPTPPGRLRAALTLLGDPCSPLQRPVMEQGLASRRVTS